MNLFSAQTYINRRKKLMDQLPEGQYLILGNHEAPMNYTDNHYPFRQDSSFAYFLGLNIPSLATILNTASGNITLYGNDFSIDDIIWMGPQPTLKDLGEQVGVTQVKPLTALKQDIKPGIHHLPIYRHDHRLFLCELLGLSSEKLAASPTFINAVVSLRSIKEEQELVELSKAVDISAQMHVTAMQAVTAGKKEYQIAAEVENVALQNHARLAYPAICTINGQTLHNHYHGNTLENGQLFLNDSGAQTHSLYAGDITRTIPVNGTFSTRQKEIYELVLKMEEDAIAALKPGMLYRDTHLLSYKIMLQGLSDLGLIKGDIETMLHAGVAGLFMPHGLGHMIGMDVHDMEDLGEAYVGYRPGLERSTQLGLKSLRLARELEAGFVITVEPGLYFIPQLLEKYRNEGLFKDFVNYSKLESYYNFGGIRIEDNIHITPTGSQILGKRIPKTVEEVQFAMKGL